MRCIREAINHGPDGDLESGLQLESGFFGEVFDTEDMREGTSAFLEKRKPRFTGR